jgi:hypothetical protein
MAETLVWVDVPCPLCGVRRDEPLLMAPTAHGTCRLARCGGCGLVYLNPRPSDDCLGLLCPDSDHADPPPNRTNDGSLGRLVGYLRRLALSRYEGYPPALRTGLERALAPLGKALLAWQGEAMTRLLWVGQGRLLACGCGSGWFGARMRELGWDVTVRDLDVHSVRPESFDVVTLGALLERVPDPHRLIEAVARALAPGGRVVVSVPHIAGWSFRTFGPNWTGLDLPRHLLHFTPPTLHRLLVGHGLTVQECRMVPRTSWLRQTVRAGAARPGVRPLKRLLCRAVAWGPLCRLIGRWSAETKQADTFRMIAVKGQRQTMARAA